jgi:hypothetical protein
VDAEQLEGLDQPFGHVGVERAHELVAALDQGDALPAADERLGHLEADVAAADDDDLLTVERAGEVEQLTCVVEGLHASDGVTIDAGEVGPRRSRAGGEQELVELHAIAAAALVVAHLDGTGGQVEVDHLVVQPHVDALLPVLLGRAGDEVFQRGHLAPDEVRDPAGRVARPPTPLEGHDLQVGLQAASLHSSRHPGGVTTDDHQPLDHGAGG